MVGRFIIEDEYTINVKVQRDTDSDHPCAPLPITLSCFDPEGTSNPQCDRTDQDYRCASPLFTLECRQPGNASNANASSSHHALPVITLVPPHGSRVASANASQYYDGPNEKVFNLVSNRDKIINKHSQKSDRNNIHVNGEPIFFCGATNRNKSSTGFLNKNEKFRKTSDFESQHLKKSSSFECINSTTQPHRTLHSRNMRPTDSIKHDSNLLPAVNVYADDESLIAKNAFQAPPNLGRKFSTSRSRSPQFSDKRNEGNSNPFAPGALFVKPIKQHCAKGNGELYVAPVDTSVLPRKSQPVLFKGNSKRNKNRNISPKESQATLSSNDEKCVPDSISSCIPNSSNDSELQKTASISYTCDAKSKIDLDHNNVIQNLARYSGEKIGITSFMTVNQPKYFRYRIDNPDDNNDCFTASGNFHFESVPISNLGRRDSFQNQKEFKSFDSSFSDDLENSYDEINYFHAPYLRKTSGCNSPTLTKTLLTEAYDKQDPLQSPTEKNEFISWPKSNPHRYVTRHYSSKMNSSSLKNDQFELSHGRPNSNLGCDNQHDFNCARTEPSLNINKGRSSSHYSTPWETPNSNRQLGCLNRFRDQFNENQFVQFHAPNNLNINNNRLGYTEDVYRSHSGEHVPEVYTSVVPTTISNDGHLPTHLNLQASLSNSKYSDFEVKRDNMIVTDEPGLQSQYQSAPFNNNHLNELGKGLSFASDRSNKYLASDCRDEFNGHANLGFDSSSVYGHENLAFDSSFGCVPFGDNNGVFDPGYGSERSEEDEMSSTLQGKLDYSTSSEDNSPSRPSSAFYDLPDGTELSVPYLMRIFPFINESSLFDVTVIKNSRGLGLAVTGGVECEDLPLPGLLRIRTLYPQTPAWLCGQLQLQDFILEANGRQLTGLTSHEALEVLRTTEREVHLVVCRAPKEVFKEVDPESQAQFNVVTTSLTAPQPILGHHYRLSPSPSYSLCGEFEIQLEKVSGSLGFTLKKNDNSILGHTIRSLVRDPALSDGRIRPGDKLLSVNGTDMCGLSHEEAVRFLRTCPESVIIRLYRDAMQTPVSPASPTEPEFFSSKPKQLRKEARDMLSDLAIRKQSSPNLSLTDSPSASRRRRLHKTPSPESKMGAADRWENLVREAEAEGDISPFDTSQADTLTGSSSSRSGTIVSRNSTGNSYKALSGSTASPSTSPGKDSRPERPNFLDLSSRHSSSRKSQFAPPHEDEELNSPPVARQYDSLDSVPQLTSTHSDTPAFSHLQVGYRSINALTTDQRLTNTSSDHNLCSKIDSPHTNNTLLKWKGVVFTPDQEESEQDNSELPLSAPENPSNSDTSFGFRIVTIEIARGWNSRLGFSLQSDGDRTVVVAIYSDSVAAKDGRLKIGDVVLKINGIDVESWSTDDIIDLLRKTRGKISITVLQSIF